MKSDTCYKWNLEDILLSEISQSQKVKYCVILPTSGNLICFKSIETKSRMADARVCGKRGMGNCCLTGTEFQFCKMKRVLETGYTRK